MRNDKKKKKSKGSRVSTSSQGCLLDVLSGGTDKNGFPSTAKFDSALKFGGSHG